MVSTVSLFPLISAVLTAVMMAVAIVVPSHHTRSTRFFVLLNGSSFLWCIGYFLRLNFSPDMDPALSAPGSLAYLVLVLLVLGAAATPTYWFLFGLAASGREHLTRGRWLLAAHIPLIYTLVVAMTNSWHHLFVLAQTGATVYGPLARFHHLSGTLMGTAGFVLFLGTLLKRPESSKLDVLSLGVSTVIPYAGSILWMTRDITEMTAQALAVPVLQPFGNIVLMVLVFRTGLADIVPVGTLRTLMENTDAQVAYLDPRLNFVTANTQFLTSVRLTEGELAGRHLSDIIGDQALLGVADSARQLKEPVEHRAWPDILGEGAGGERTYWNWSLRPVRNRGRLRAFVFSITDVTAEVGGAELGNMLGRLTRRLHSTFEPEEVLPTVIADAGRILGADVCSLVLGRDGEWRWVQACESPEWEVFDPEGWSHFRLAVQMRRPVEIVDAEKDIRGLGWHVTEEGIRRVLTVPLVVGENVVGAISFGGSAPGRFASAQVAFIHELARAIVDSMKVAGRYQSERKISQTLQDALLRLPERVPGIELAHAYHSATESARVGGDFYDLFELDSGVVAMVIADLSGKGVEAAALTSLVKSSIRAEAMRYASPGGVLAAANEGLRRQFEVGTFSTAFYGVLELDSGMLRYSSAGHPGPYVLRKNGSVERLKGNAGMLGVFEGMEYPCHATALERGDVVLMYTDGLIETRRKGGAVDEDYEPLLASLAHHDPASVVDAVLLQATEACGGQLKDDVAVLAIRLA